MTVYKCAIFILITCVLTACAGGKKTAKKSSVLPGNWQATPLVIDGDNPDWPSPYPNYDAKAKIAYATSNDGRYIYLTVETGDELTQMKMLRAGMTVSIDTDGKKGDTYNINFPLESDNMPLEMPEPDGKQHAAMHTEQQMRQQVKKGLEHTTQYSLSGFGSCDGGYSISQVAPCGIKLAMKLNSYKELVWEAAIPVKAIFNRDSLNATDAGKTINMCVAVNAIKPPKSAPVENANNGMNQSMGSGGNRGGMGGGHMPTGGGRTPENPMQHMFNNTKTWKHFSLAARP